MRKIIIALLFIVYGFADKSFLLDSNINIFHRALTYHWYHANIFHLLANTLSICFVFHPRRKNLIRNFFTALIIATFTYFIATRPLIGISNILFAMAGLYTPPLSHPYWKSTNTKIFLGITTLMLLVPQVSALTHIVSFICGCVIASIRRLNNEIKRATGK